MKTNILVSSEKEKLKRFIIGTHDGIFHADEVVACAILCLFHSDDDIEIVRSKNVAFLYSKEVDIILDVGGGCYDHHQKGGNGKRKNGFPYASAGLVWREYGELLISKCCNKLYGVSFELNETMLSYLCKLLDEKLIQEVDKEDNGIYTSLHTFSFISSFLPMYESSYCSFDEAFELALHTTIQILQHEIFQAIARLKAQKDISNMIKNNGIIDFHILEIPSQTFPWLESVISHNLLSICDGALEVVYFVIFPYPSGGWAAQCVPPSLQQKFLQRIPFPKEWAGQTDKLAEISGVEDATFCHNGCFFVRAKSKEGIIDLCRKAFSDYEKSL